MVLGGLCQDRWVSDIQIHDDAENHRYVIEVDGERAGLAVYHIRGDRYFFVHTEVDPAFKARGLGTKLARHALDDVRSKDKLIVPLCPFIAAFVKRNPDYRDMVDQEMLDRINSERMAQTS